MEFMVNPELQVDCKSQATASSTGKKCGNATFPVVMSPENTITNVVYYENEAGDPDFFQEIS